MTKRALPDGRLSRRLFLKRAGAAALAPLVLGRTLAQGSLTDPIRIGVVLPVPTGNPVLTDIVGTAARTGALLAEGLLGGVARARGTSLEVLGSSSPTPDAAVRAAERLVAIEEVAALVGGLGVGQASALASVAEASQVPFFDIGGPASRLDDTEPRPYTFHVGASAAMYMAALAQWFGPSGARRWFLLYEDSDVGRVLYQRATNALTRSRSQDVGHAAVQPDQRVYDEVLEHIQDVAPDVVMVLLPPVTQEFFHSQYDRQGLEFPITGLPEPITQTRRYYGRLLQSAPRAAAGYRAALWETTLHTHGAQELNEQFIGRSGNPMDPAGWAAYAAVRIAFDAILDAESLEGPALVRHLGSPDAVFDVAKSLDVSFRASDHQLQQPLYIVELIEGAALGASLADRLGLAKLAGEVRPDGQVTHRST